MRLRLILEISSDNRAQLREEVRRMRTCDGAASRVQLRVDEISCQRALRLLVRTSQTDLARYCPVGWRHVHNPQRIGAPVGATLCHRDLGRGDHPNPDLRARAMLYVLPHALGQDHDHCDPNRRRAATTRRAPRPGAVGRCRLGGRAASPFAR